MTRFLGGNPKDLPHPGVDWTLFLSRVKDLNKNHPKTFCPITGQLRPWVDVNKLMKIYGAECNQGKTSQSCTIS